MSADVQLQQRYHRVRDATTRLSEPLSPEDQQLQSMANASPTKWHLAHTSWFFETFLLAQTPSYHPFDEAFSQLFNSYYNTVGAAYARPRRGLLSRPGAARVLRYRETIDAHIDALFRRGALTPQQRDIIILGLNHEQQHQELLLTDIKHALAQNPTFPAYLPATASTTSAAVEAPLRWHSFDGGMVDIGHHGDSFCFDNERPRHRTYLPPFTLASRLVTSADWQAFIRDGGYTRHALWLSDGWDWVQRHGITAPLYWTNRGSDTAIFTLHGLQPLHPHQPVVHISYFEADAYARWANARLPREAELEVAARGLPLDGNFVDAAALHPAAAPASAAAGHAPQQLYGDCWEWTQSSYSAYPGYRPPAGALGEYNGKFMCNQHVLRGGSCVTPRSHMRPSYRNFFHATARWQFSGVRLARDV
ncbi:MAG TPA: ergothioneine biosynthesis protein EgtB [Sorangium sp.]|nr:ergothioneine biosynthesis protein EgtB [Sorangium sp.]